MFRDRMADCAVCINTHGYAHWDEEHLQNLVDDFESGHTILPVIEIPIKGVPSEISMNHHGPDDIQFGHGLLDSGSSDSLITTRARELSICELVESDVKIHIQGVSGDSYYTTNKWKIFIMNPYDPNVVQTTLVVTEVPDLPAHLFLKKPIKPNFIPYEQLNCYSAYPKHFTSFDLIIGEIDIFRFVSDHKPRHDYNFYYTHFGLVFSGQKHASSINPNPRTHGHQSNTLKLEKKAHKKRMRKSKSIVTKNSELEQVSRITSDFAQQRSSTIKQSSNIKPASCKVNLDSSPTPGSVPGTRVSPAEMRDVSSLHRAGKIRAGQDYPGSGSVPESRALATKIRGDLSSSYGVAEIEEIADNYLTAGSDLALKASPLKMSSETSPFHESSENSTLAGINANFNQKIRENERSAKSADYIADNGLNLDINPRLNDPGNMSETSIEEMNNERPPPVPENMSDHQPKEAHPSTGSPSGDKSKRKPNKGNKGEDKNKALPSNPPSNKTPSSKMKSEANNSPQSQKNPSNGGTKKGASQDTSNVHCKGKNKHSQNCNKCHDPNTPKPKEVVKQRVINNQYVRNENLIVWPKPVREGLDKSVPNAQNNEASPKYRYHVNYSLTCAKCNQTSYKRDLYVKGLNRTLMQMEKHVTDGKSFLKTTFKYNPEKMIMETQDPHLSAVGPEAVVSLVDMREYNPQLEYPPGCRQATLNHLNIWSQPLSSEIPNSKRNCVSRTCQKDDLYHLHSCQYSCTLCSCEHCYKKRLILQNNHARCWKHDYVICKHRNASEQFQALPKTICSHNWHEHGPQYLTFNELWNELNTRKNDLSRKREHVLQVRQAELKPNKRYSWIMHQRKPHLCDEEGDLNFDYKMNEILKKRYDMFINMITPSLDFDMASSDSEAHDLDYEDITDDELEVFDRDSKTPEAYKDQQNDTEKMEEVPGEKEQPKRPDTPTRGMDTLYETYMQQLKRINRHDTCEVDMPDNEDSDAAGSRDQPDSYAAKVVSDTAKRYVQSNYFTGPSDKPDIFDTVHLSTFKDTVDQPYYKNIYEYLAQLKLDNEEVSDQTIAYFGEYEWKKAYIYKSQLLASGRNANSKIANRISSYSTSKSLTNLSAIAELLAKQNEFERIVDTEEQSTAEHVAAASLCDKVLVYNKEKRYFETDLLIRPGSKLENNFANTYQRMLSTEKKLKDNPVAKGILYEEVTKLGDLHATEEVFDEHPERGNNKHYLPYIMAEKPESTSSRYRFCMDGGATHRKGQPSLNQVIFDCPRVNNNLISVELNSRKARYILLSDVRKLYIQLRLREESRDLLRFLIRFPDQPDKLRIFRYTRTIWGIKDSGFQSMIAIERLFKMRIENLHLEFPEKSESERESLSRKLRNAMKCFYVDDFIISASTIGEIVETFNLVQSTLAIAQMKLCKISSNSEEVLKAFPDDLKEKVVDYVVKNKDPPNPEYTIKVSDNTSVLGYQYSPFTDTYNFTKYKDLTKEFTFPMKKIDLASLLPRFYDNLGLLSPWKLLLKVAMRSCNLMKLDWKDSLDKLDPKDQLDVKDFLNDIPLLEKLSFPRCVHATPESKILVFCDGSTRGVSVAMYIVSKIKGKYISNLLMAVSNIVPMKTTGEPLNSIPKIELVAAFTASKYASMLLEEICGNYNWNIPKSNFYLITDSKCVLAWIKQIDVSKQTVFVKNKCEKIKEKGFNWYHCNGTDNCADIGSRGCRLELLFHSDYQNGYPWIRQDSSQYKNVLRTNVDFDNLEVLEGIAKKYIMSYLTQMNIPIVQKRYISYHLSVPRATKPLPLQTTRVSDDIFVNPDATYSSVKHIKRIFGTLYFAIHKFKTGVQRNEHYNLRRKKLVTLRKFDKSYYLPAEFIKKADKFLIRLIQKRNYPQEVKLLTKGQRISVNSEIANVDPYLDTDGILRTSGRLEHYPKNVLKFDTKHQIILASDELTIKYLFDDHLRLDHPGVEAHKTLLIRKYYIPKQHSTVIKARRLCIKCRIVHAKVRHQQMGPTLHEDINLSKLKVRPFAITGVDLSGAITLWNINYGEFCNVTKKEVTDRQTRSKTVKYDIHKKHYGVEPFSFKAYIIIYICCQSGAVYLDLVPSAKTGSFLLSLKRFCAENGTPSVFCSDRAGIFTKTEKLLRESTSLINELKQAASTLEIDWKYSPSYLSYKASKWERSFRVLKDNFYKIAGNHKICFDEALTALKCIQRNMNSSPHSPVAFKSKNNNELIVPSDLLHGRKLEDLPLYPGIMDSKIFNDEILEKSSNFITNWVEQVTQEMLRSYMVLENTRSKWKLKEKPHKVGDLIGVSPVQTKKKLDNTKIPKALISKVIPSKRHDVVRKYEIDYGNDNKHPYKRIKDARTEVRDQNEILPFLPTDYLQSGKLSALYYVAMNRPVKIIPHDNILFRLERE